MIQLVENKQYIYFYVEVGILFILVKSLFLFVIVRLLLNICSYSKPKIYLVIKGTIMSTTIIPTEMTFFARFESDILSGKKTITIRDEAESYYVPGTTVDVSTYEDGRWFCRLNILTVEPIAFNDLNDFHAQQENMTLAELKAIIHDIYPGIEQLYVVNYALVK